MPPDRICATCISGSIQIGVGLSTYLLPKTENAIAFAFLKLNLEDGSGTPGSFRFGPSALLGLDLRLDHSIKLLSEFELTQYLDGHWGAESGNYSQSTAGISWNAIRNFELRAVGIYFRFPTENYATANLAAGFYF